MEPANLLTLAITAFDPVSVAALARDSEVLAQGSVEECLTSTGISPHAIDQIVFNGHPLIELDEFMQKIVSLGEASGAVVEQEFAPLFRKLWVHKQAEHLLGGLGKHGVFLALRPGLASDAASAALYAASHPFTKFKPLPIAPNPEVSPSAAQIDWLNLSDTERLVAWATLAHAGEITNKLNALPELQTYSPYSPRGMRERLDRLWKDRSWANLATLKDIVIAAFFKNDPYPPNYDKDMLGGGNDGSVLF